MEREEFEQAAEQDDPGDDLSGAVRERLESFLPEIVKKTFAAGLGAVFSTEEGVRKLAKELTLPKDVANYLVGTASSTKDEVMRIVAGEVREFLKTVRLSEEIAGLLTKIQLDVKTEIRFSPNVVDGSVEPDVATQVAVKKAPADDQDG